VAHDRRVLTVDASAADRLVELLGDDLDHGRPDRSFSPFWSNVGLGFADASGDAAGGFAGGPGAAHDAAAADRGEPRRSPGVATLYLHYNRVTRALGAPFLAVAGTLRSDRRGALAVDQTLDDGGRIRVAFGDTNTFLVEAEGVPVARLAFLDDPALERLRVARRGAWRRYDALLPTLDERDPDRAFPIALGVRLLRGSWDDDAEPGRMRADADGVLRLAVTVALLDVDDRSHEERLAHAPASFDEAEARSRRWLADALGAWTPPEPTPEAARLAATAAYALLTNTCAAPGLLAGRLASFPSRGGYPVHFLWDACFHVLGLELMTPRLASDALELLVDRLRADGKMPHFIASTWVRPHASQPPLVGWAAERLIERRGDLGLARRLLPGLDANNGWWLTQRMTRFGLIACDDPFETGWDDTPRLDRGPILALDMNAYLLRQLRATARLAERLGEVAIAARNAERADRLDAAILERLYDPERRVFLDAGADDGLRRPLVTPAALLPLWAGVSLEREEAQAMVREVLLHPAKLFGAVPFPSVAYDEPAYRSGQWWRGPTWPPIAVLMIELLQDLGFRAEGIEAERRLYELLLRDGDLHELFDSRTGAGLGQRHQGWTAATFLWLAARRTPANTATSDLMEA
jgi:hypothetical protein